MQICIHKKLTNNNSHLGNIFAFIVFSDDSTGVLPSKFHGYVKKSHSI